MIAATTGHGKKGKKQWSQEKSKLHTQEENVESPKCSQPPHVGIQGPTP